MREPRNERETHSLLEQTQRHAELHKAERLQPLEPEVPAWPFWLLLAVGTLGIAAVGWYWS